MGLVGEENCIFGLSYWN